MTAGWKRLYKWELHNLYYHGEDIKEEVMGGVCRKHLLVEKYMTLALKAEGKRSLGRSSHEWEDNIEYDERKGLD
jgi:hypothetical protein